MKKVHVFIQKAVEDQQTVWPRDGMSKRTRNHMKSSAVGLSKELPADKPTLSKGQDQRKATNMASTPPGPRPGGTMAASSHLSQN